MKKNKFLSVQIKTRAVVLFLTSAITSTVYAGVIVEHSGTVSAGSQYHSNLLLLPDNLKESVVLYRVIPQYKISVLDEKNKWFGSLGLQIERATNNDIAQGVENPFATLGWQHEFFLGTFSLQADYSKQRLVNSQFGQTGFVSQNGTSETQSLAALWTYGFAPKWISEANINYSDSKFRDVNGLVGFKQTSAGVKVNYIYNETIQPYVSLSAFDLDSDQDASITQWQQYILGTTIEFSTKLNLDISAGVTNFNGAGTSKLGGIIANYINNRHTLTFALQRTVFPTGEQLIETANSFSGDYTYALSEISNIGTSARFNRNESGLDTDEYIAFYSRDLTPLWAFRLDLAHRKQALQDTFQDDSIGFSFTYKSFNF